jgi:hypothetical protein
MKDNRYLSADIDPATGERVNRLKSKALALVRRELTTAPDLHDDAEVAILNDCDGMDGVSLVNLLRTFSLVLNHLERKQIYQKMAGLLAGLLRVGIHKMTGDALDSVTIQREGLKMQVGGKTTLVGTMNNELLSIVSLGKESHMMERRLEMVEKLIAEPGPENLKAVSQTFQMPVKDVEKITNLILNLFRDRKYFIRSAFDVSLGDLAIQGSRAFELAWCVSKLLEGRGNRVACLNALQHLISRMQRPKQALRFLLADFCRFPDRVQFSDRNAMMLVNILLRSYNKELDVDIEMTPVEVLNVRDGLVKDIVNYAQFRIDTIETRFSTKVRAIHDKLTALLESSTPSQEKLTIRHLLFLEREIFIFLSLLSGKTAHTILISALNEYGNPLTGIYRYPRAASYLPVFLQQLKIIARGLGRIGTLDDVESLQQISRHGPQLNQLYGSKENQVALARTMRGIDTAMKSIFMAHASLEIIEDASA